MVNAHSIEVDKQKVHIYLSAACELSSKQNHEKLGQVTKAEQSKSWL